MPLNEIEVPKTWDLAFLETLFSERVPVGTTENETTITLQIPERGFDIVYAAVEAYPAAYLPTAQEKALARIAEIGKQKALNFTFNGMPLVLDEVTEGRIGRAVQWLERPAQAEVTTINWDKGVGDFVALPREVMFALGDATGAHIQAVFDKRKQLTDRVLAATTIDDAVFADIETTVWPGDPTT